MSCAVLYTALILGFIKERSESHSQHKKYFDNLIHVVIIVDVSNVSFPLLKICRVFFFIMGSRHFYRILINSEYTCVMAIFAFAIGR